LGGTAITIGTKCESKRPVTRFLKKKKKKKKKKNPTGETATQ
jgi:hypothetical protein